MLRYLGQCIGYEEAIPLPRVSFGEILKHRIVLLGPSQTGKTKLVYEFCNPNGYYQFPSVKNTLEQLTLTLDNNLWARVELTFCTTPMKTLDTLLMSYLRKASVVVLTYSISQLQHLRMIETKYLPMLTELSKEESFFVVFVGTKTINNPFVSSAPPSSIHEFMRKMILSWLTYSVRKSITTTVATFEVVVDDYRDVQLFKDAFLNFVLTQL